MIDVESFSLKIQHEGIILVFPWRTTLGLESFSVYLFHVYCSPGVWLGLTRSIGLGTRENCDVKC